MADNEAKARKKLEEAEKKAKGGGGFLGSLFGGSKTDEAADLFVQEHSQSSSLQTIGGNDTCQSVWQRWRQRQQDLHSPITTDTESDSDSDKDDNEICCVEKGCGQIFADVCAYEEHYEREHRHQCGVCGRKFLTERCLEIHADETHSWLFQAQLHANFQKNESIALYRCFDSACSKAFVNSDERSLHSLKEHFIEDGGAIESQKRKAARKAPSEQNASKGSQLCAEIGEALDEMNMSPSSTISSKDHVTARVGQGVTALKPRVVAVPRAIVFGASDLDLDEPQPMFESGSVRRMLKSTKACQRSTNPQ